MFAMLQDLATYLISNETELDDVNSLKLRRNRSVSLGPHPFDRGPSFDHLNTLPKIGPIELKLCIYALATFLLQ